MLPPDVEHVFYSDTVVVFLANLAALWRQRDPTVVFQWGEPRCAGVVLLHLANMQRFWELAARVVRLGERYDDQQLMRAVEGHHPGDVGRLSPAWDMHLAGGLCRFKDRLPGHHGAAGFLHFSGGGSSLAYMDKGGAGRTSSPVGAWRASIWTCRGPASCTSPEARARTTGRNTP